MSNNALDFHEAFLARHVRQLCSRSRQAAAATPDALAPTAAAVTDFPVCFEEDDAAVVIVDISGYSKLTTELCQELGNSGRAADRLLQTINPYFDRLIRIAVAYGGDIFKFAGDSMMVAWTPDTMHDPPPARTLPASPAARALACCLHLLTRTPRPLRRLLRRRQPPRPPQLPSPPPPAAVAQTPPPPPTPAARAPLGIHVGLGLGRLQRHHAGVRGVRRECFLAGTAVAAARAGAGRRAGRRGRRRARGVGRRGAVPAAAAAGSAGHGGKGNDHDDDAEEVVVVGAGAARALAAVVPMLSAEAVAAAAAEAAMAAGMSGGGGGGGGGVVGLQPFYLEYVNEALARRIRDSASEVQSSVNMIRKASVVFVKFKDFPENNPQEALVAAQRVMEIVVPVLRRFKGTMRQFNVDDKGATILLVWGLPPFSHERDAYLAVKASIKLRNKFAKSLGFGFSIGTTTGSIFTGIIGNTLRSDHSVIGAAVNEAARLMCDPLAEGSVLCDEATFAESKQYVRFLPDAPTIKIKGRPDPIRVHIPVQVGKNATKGEAGLALVGREAERSILSDALSAWRDSTGGERGAGVVFVTGEDGVGKRALCECFTQEAASTIPGLVSLVVDASTGETLLRSIPADLFDAAHSPAGAGTMPEPLRIRPGSSCALHDDLESDSRAPKVRDAWALPRDAADPVADDDARGGSLTPGRDETHDYDAAASSWFGEIVTAPTSPAKKRTGRFADLDADFASSPYGAGGGTDAWPGTSATTPTPPTPEHSPSRVYLSPTLLTPTSPSAGDATPLLPDSKRASDFVAECRRGKTTDCCGGGGEAAAAGAATSLAAGHGAVGSSVFSLNTSWSSLGSVAASSGAMEELVKRAFALMGEDDAAALSLWNDVMGTAFVETTETRSLTLDQRVGFLERLLIRWIVVLGTVVDDTPSAFLLVSTTTPKNERARRLNSKPGARSLEVRNLDSAQSRLLLLSRCAEAGVNDVDRELWDEIYKQTEGNSAALAAMATAVVAGLDLEPTFAVDAEGRLTVRAGTSVAAAVEDALPHSSSAVVLQYDKLSERFRRVLAVAACLGQQFPLKALWTACMRDPQCQEYIGQMSPDTLLALVKSEDQFSFLARDDERPSSVEVNSNTSSSSVHTPKTAVASHRSDDAVVVGERRMLRFRHGIVRRGILEAVCDSDRREIEAAVFGVVAAVAAAAFIGAVFVDIGLGLHHILPHLVDGYSDASILRSRIPASTRSEILGTQRTLLAAATASSSTVAPRWFGLTLAGSYALLVVISVTSAALDARRRLVHVLTLTLVLAPLSVVWVRILSGPAAKLIAPSAGSRRPSLSPTEEVQALYDVSLAVVAFGAAFVTALFVALGTVAADGDDDVAPVEKPKKMKKNQ
ncbi:hypothetical protein DFJ73DRAFT_797745 [Zopfochytrium polystomum]|nr:hypothetical protein DFJ73DRAFT_797745 [Zopfochytrium polystomum]